MRLTWLADVLRAAGLTVVEVDGWKSRGVEYATAPLGVICHETQGSATSSVQGELNVLINGRTGLPGPIAQLMIDRKGVWYVVASGRCNQVKTGWGGPLSGKGNSYSFGIEAMHAVSEDWANKLAQYASYVTGVAAICARMRWQPDGHVIGHKEHQPGDKSDPEFSMPAFRAAVNVALEGGDMAAYDDYDKAALRFIDNRLAAIVQGLDDVAGTKDATHARGEDVWLVRTLKTLAADVAALKKAPPQPAPIVTDEQLERVMRKVLGGLDGASPSV